jgi:hypothetical protein
MLAKEKKRSAWSIAIGLIAAMGIAGWSEFEARQLDARARAIIAECESAKAKGPELPKGYIEVCDPNDFTPKDPGELPGELGKVALARKQAQYMRDDWALFPLIALGIFCLPLVWYLILDRIREVSAAVSGRDQAR